MQKLEYESELNPASFMLKLLTSFMLPPWFIIFSSQPCVDQTREKESGAASTTAAFVVLLCSSRRRLCPCQCSSKSNTIILLPSFLSFSVLVSIRVRVLEHHRNLRSWSGSSTTRSRSPTATGLPRPLPLLAGPPIKSRTSPNPTIILPITTSMAAPAMAPLITRRILDGKGAGIITIIIILLRVMVITSSSSSRCDMFTEL